jgi:hypothetical protein
MPQGHQESEHQNGPTTMRTITTAILILLLASYPAQAGVPETVAIGVDTSNLDPKIAAEIQDSIPVYAWNGLRDGLSKVAKTKVQLIPISEAKIVEQIQNCDSEACLQDVAQSASADLVVRVKVQTKKASKKRKPEYVISLIVVRALPGRDAWQDKSDCKDCGSSEINHMASLVAGSIAEKIKIDVPPPPKATPPVSPPIATLPQPIPPPASIMNPPPVAKEPSEWYVPRYLSISALGGGAALIVTGIVLRKIDGDGSCTLPANKQECSMVYSTGGLGTGLIWGGGAAMLGGLAGLLFFGPSSENSHVAVGFSGSSLLVGGAF